MNFKLPALVLSLLILAQTSYAQRAPYTTIVFEEGGTYTALDGFGNLLLSVDPSPHLGDIAAAPFPNPGDDPAPLLQAAFNRKGDIYVAGGSYDFKESFQGLRVRSFSRISIARDATFTVPRGFSNALFTFQSVQATTLEGGFYTEEGGAGNIEAGIEPAPRRWTLFRFVGGEDAAGCHGNVIRDIRTWFVGKVIHLTATSSTGWNNGNRFSNFSVFAYRVGIEFSKTGLFQRNYFDNLIYQTDPFLRTRTGARRIRGVANTFLNVYFYDAVVGTQPTGGDPQGDIVLATLPVERITGNVAWITEEATGTLIIGGIMTQPVDKFVDNGVNTQIIDELHRPALHPPTPHPH